MPTAADNLSQDFCPASHIHLFIRAAWTSLALDAIMTIREDLVSSAVSLTDKALRIFTNALLGDM